MTDYNAMLIDLLNEKIQKLTKEKVQKRREIERLTKENARLKKENDLLKYSDNHK